MSEQNPHILLSDAERSGGIRKYCNAEDQELDRLKEAIKRTPDERFAFLMELMRMQRLMKGSQNNQK